MVRLEMTWTWTTLSSLHCGSGLSEPGYADRLVQTDLKGNPVLLGDAVKGALRMSAEQVLSWLKANDAHYHHSSHTGSAEPEHAVLAALFGGAGRQHYAPGTLGSTAVAKTVTAATAIDRHSGRAKDDTLRYIESVDRGARFECRCTIWFDREQLVEPSITLLLAALAATESVGAKAGIGWGKVKSEDAKVIVVPAAAGASEDVVDCDAALDWKRLEVLAASGDLPADAGATKPFLATTLPAAAPAPLQWWKLTVNLDEPTCFGSRPDVSNKVATLDAIPATALRGALREAWLRLGIHESAILQLLGSESRWTPAVPAVASQRNLIPCVPIPQSFSRAKEEAGFGSPNGIQDDLSDAAVDNDRDTSVPLQRRPVGEGWMSLVSADPQPPQLRALKTQEHKEMRMHVARDYMTGSKRTGALFAREALTPTDSRGFIAYVGLPASAPVQWPPTVFLGKRRSAGNGQARIHVERVEGTQRPWPKSWFESQVALVSSPSPSGTTANRHTDVFVQLLSSAIMRDGNGMPLLTLGLSEWEQLLWMPPASPPTGWALPEGFLRRTAARSVPSWMMTWKHGRAGVSCIIAGSVWRIRCKDRSLAFTVRRQLAALAAVGLGERGHEGFGWFVIDPPWLGHWRIAQGTDASSEKPPTGSRRAWPGCENVAADISALAQRVRRLNVPSTLHSPLQELASRARGATAEHIRGTLLPFCDRMAERARESNRWRLLKDGPHPTDVRGVLNDYAATPDLFRFALEALLIRATPTKEANE